MERDDFLAAAWEGLLEGIKASEGAERRTAMMAEKDTFLDIILGSASLCLVGVVDTKYGLPVG
jgi:hypothetical protein